LKENQMTRSKIIFAAVVAGAGILCAQTPASPYADLKKNYDMVKDSLQKMAEEMPEANYSFKPTPDMRSFGGLMAHVADVQGMFCATVSGAPKPPSAGSKTAKADLVAALKNSSAICDAAFDSLTAATANQLTGMMGLSKLGLLEFNTGHSNEEYGYGSVYMRLKGVVPPSSAPRGR
jgi:DinB superfamily